MFLWRSAITSRQRAKIGVAAHFIDSYVGYLKDRTEAYVNRMAEVRPEAGEPNVAGYQYWNALTVGPIQFLGTPPYSPSKIIAAGEPALMLGAVWINPTGGVPATVVLGARPFRVRFETINLSMVSAQSARPGGSLSFVRPQRQAH